MQERYLKKRQPAFASEIKKFAFVSISVILLPIVIIILFNLTKMITGITPESIKYFSKGNILIELSIVLLIYLVKSILFFIPIAFIYILTGSLFSPVYAIIFNLIGMSLSLTVTFFIGRKLGKDIVHKFAEKSKKVQSFMDNPEKNNITLFILRISGIFPVELLSLVCGSTNYKYLNFLGLSLVAMAPGMIPFSIMGKAVTNPFSKEFLIPLIIALAIMIISLVYYKKKNPVL